MLRTRLIILSIVAAASIPSAFAEVESESRPVTVSAEEDETEHDQFTEMGEYAQPAWAERSRLSSSTRVYVLSPQEMFAGSIWETSFRRHGKTTQELTQEIDYGLLHRFELGLENDVGLGGSDANETAVKVEARYAFANWNAVPFNPAVSVEYSFGVGRSVRLPQKTDHNTFRHEPNRLTATALLGQNFGDHVGYGMNIFADLAGGSDRTVGLTQSVAYAFGKGALELGAEFKFAHAWRHNEDELAIGPDLSWKLTRQLRMAVAPLIGCTHDSPRLAVSLLVSYEFGGAEAIVSPATQQAH